MVLLAGLVLVLGPGRDYACLASDDAGTRVVQSPSAVEEVGLISVQYADWHFSGDQSGDKVGQSVAGGGDVNGGGYDDVVVGAYHAQERHGAAYIFYGTYSGLVDEPSVTLTSDDKGSEFGKSVAIAGDVDNDGWDDVIVGAPHYKNDDTYVGAVFLFLGDPTGMDDVADWEYLGSEQGQRVGESVAGAGDVNGDGYDDVIVGAPGYPGGDEASKGAILLFYGQPDPPYLSSDPNWLYESDQAGAQLGAAVAAAGDVDSNGRSDLIAGAPTYDTTQGNEGAAFVFLGSSTVPGTSPDWTVYGEQEGARLGTSVSTAGDVDCDAYDDVIVGIPGYSSSSELGEQEGAALVFCGSSDGLDNERCWRHICEQAGSGFGSSVSTAGDLDGDGCDDVIVGAPQYQPVADRGADGAAFVFHGASNGLQDSISWMIYNEKNVKDELSALATSVGSAGDVNGDGVDDLLLGAPAYFVQQTAVGRAFAFYGPLEPSQLQPAAYLPLIMSNAN
jgi:hypothetical protein